MADVDINSTIYKQPFNATFNYSDLQELSVDDLLYDVPVGIVVLLSIFYGTISILAVIGNGLVIWIVATTRQMQTVTNLFIANLALADVIIGMFAIPFQVNLNLLNFLFEVKIAFADNTNFSKGIWKEEIFLDCIMYLR